MPWCKFFIPKIASPDIKAGDPFLNDNIEYAKCIKGHVIRDAADWINCENLPTPDSQCWLEGGVTLLQLAVRTPKDASAETSLDDKSNSLPQHSKP